MNNSMDCVDNSNGIPQTDWHDAARIAQIARMDIQQVRYHWRRAWLTLDLPPLATGFLDAERAVRLITYCNARRHINRRNWRRRRPNSTVR